MKFSSVKRFFALGCAHVEVGQDFATVHTSTLEDYEKGILLMSNAV